MERRIKSQRTGAVAIAEESHGIAGTEDAISLELESIKRFRLKASSVVK